MWKIDSTNMNKMYPCTCLYPRLFVMAISLSTCSLFLLSHSLMLKENVRKKSAHLLKLEVLLGDKFKTHITAKIDGFFFTKSLGILLLLRCLQVWSFLLSLSQPRVKSNWSYIHSSWLTGLSSHATLPFQMKTSCKHLIDYKDFFLISVEFFNPRIKQQWIISHNTK